MGSLERLRRPVHRRPRPTRPLVALPTLTHTFNTSLTTIQWVLLIYDLTLIGLVITVGRLGDLFGRRRFYTCGFLIFVVSSAFCGAAQSATPDYFVSRPASRRRRDDFRQRARRGLDRIPVKRAGQGHGSDLHGISRRFSHRPDSRRFSHRQRRLALDLFYQSPDRHLGRISGMEAARRKPGKARTHFGRFSRRGAADDDLQFVDLWHESIAARRLERSDGAAACSACLRLRSCCLFSSNCARPCRS